MDNSIVLCPKCKSRNVLSSVLVFGYTYVHMKDGAVVEVPNELDFDVSDVREYECFDCEYAWSGSLPENIWRTWEKEKERAFEQNN